MKSTHTSAGSPSSPWTTWLSALTLAMTALAWLFPEPLHRLGPYPTYIIVGLLLSALLSSLYSLALVIKSARISSRVVVKLAALSLPSLVAVFYLGFKFAAMSTNHSPARPPAHLTTPPARYDGLLDLTTYCTNRFGPDFWAVLDQNPRCFDGAVAYPADPSSACEWQYGSTLASLEPTTFEVLCDTTRATLPPCNEDQRACGARSDLCCPAILAPSPSGG